MNRFMDDKDDMVFGVAQPFRQKNWKGLGHRKDGMRAWDFREFISFDGEGTAVDEPLNVSPGILDPAKTMHYRDGKIIHDYVAKPQPYVLLGNSKGERITAPPPDGLSTVECFEFLLDSKVRHPHSIFTAFAFNYDVNQMLKDFSPRQLELIHEKGFCVHRGYWVRWLPRKSLIVSHRRTKRSMIIYDSFGFFQTSFLQACEKYLITDPLLDLIKEGKQARREFSWEDLDSFMIPYNDAEMKLHVEMMNILRKELHTVGVDPTQWHGPGAVANQVFSINRIPTSRDIPGKVLDASQFAYAGGRFELLRMGRYQGTVYEYDIRSAYPAATTQLPDISQGHWEDASSFDPLSFGLWRVKYDRVTGDWHTDNRPKPLFCRSEKGNICYPNTVEGWYWTPEARLLDRRFIRSGYIFQPHTTDRPFAFVEAMYEQRRILKSQANPAERALKSILNSLYGKMAQTVGGKGEPPRWHQLEYAGYITSYTRAKIYEAIMLNPDAIIASETDAVFSTEPLDLPLSEELGDWEETIFDEICYLQSGFYYAIKDGEIICKYRGMDRDKDTGQPLGLPYDKVLQVLQRPIPRKHLISKTTRFNGLGIGLRTKAVWRSWETKDHGISLQASPYHPRRYKRNHIVEECPQCIRGVSLYDGLHKLEIGGYSGKSYARALPWRTVAGAEMNPDWRDMGEDFDRWQ